MKKVVAVFKKAGPDQYPIGNEYFHKSYLELTKVMQKLGGNLFMAKIADNYQGSGKFKESWCFNENSEFVEAGPLTASSIYNKGRFRETEVPILNDYRFEDICRNKNFLYGILHDLSPYSQLVLNQESFNKAIETLSQAKQIVIKPNTGSSGRQVYIVSPQEAKDLAIHNLDQGFVVQEFFDSSIGIPGLCTGTHDIRIALLNGEHAYTQLRVPKSGSLIANYAQGGSFEILSTKQTPNEFIDAAKHIDQQIFAHLNPKRFIAVDLINTNSGIKFLEANDSVGLIHASGQEFIKKFQNELAQTLLDIAI